MYILTESFKQLDPVYYFDTDSDYFDILETCWQESKEQVEIKKYLHLSSPIALDAEINKMFLAGSRPLCS